MTYNPNKLVIDKDKIDKNIKNLKKLVGENVSLMPVIKNNAYGIGVQNIMDILIENDIKIVGVANLEEALSVKRLSFSGDVLLLLPAFYEQIPQIVEYDVIASISDLNFLKRLNEEALRNNKVVRVHVEIDTGMGRSGLKNADVKKLFKDLESYKNIVLEGIYTHFSSVIANQEYTQEQLRKFNQIIKYFENNGMKFKYIHACGTSGILCLPEARFNLVRPGISLYGYYPDEKVKEKCILFPALTLRSEISFIHIVNRGEKVGYNGVYKAEKDMRVALIPMGFADAFMGLESNIGKVLVKGSEKVSVIAICMDTMIIDITDAPDVSIGDEVLLWDNKNIKLEDYGEWTKTSNYEVLSILSNRIQRIIS